MVSVDDAIRSANAFTRKIGVKVTGDASVERILFQGGQGGYYSLHIGELLLSVDIHTGRVTCYTDMGHETKRGKRRLPKSRHRIRNAAKAREVLAAFAKIVGVQKDLSLAHFSYFGRGDSTTQAEEPADRITGRFEPMKYGYIFYGAVESHCLSVDPADGVLLRYGYTPGFPFVVDSHIPRLSFQEASRAAEKTATDHQLGQNRTDDLCFQTRSKAKPSFLAYVRDPSSPVNRSKKQASRFRLAWVLCYPGEDKVFIDAGDGRMLGYVSEFEAHNRRSVPTKPDFRRD